MIKLYILFIILSSPIFSQTYQGVDLTNFHQQSGFVSNGKDNDGHNIFEKKDVSYFQTIRIIDGIGIIFKIDRSLSTAMKWVTIYDELVLLLGKESGNEDYIPAGVSSTDYDALALLCLSGAARLGKYWTLTNIAVNLGFFEEGIGIACFNR